MQSFRPHLVLKRKDLDRMISPCVYVFKKNGNPLYVGSTKVGLQRPLFTNHGSWSRRIADEVCIQFFKSEKDARKFEQILIHRWTPIFNFVSPAFLVPAFVRKRMIEKRKQRPKILKDRRKNIAAIEKKNVEIRALIDKYKGGVWRGQINLIPIN
jgi:hypothetical protein